LQRAQLQKEGAPRPRLAGFGKLKMITYSRAAAIMATGKRCPVCNSDIATWSVFRGYRPGTIHCPQCRIRLQNGATGVVAAVLVLIAILLIAGGLWLVNAYTPTDPTNRWLVWSVALLAMLPLFWVPAEYFIARYLYSRKTLTHAEDDAARQESQ
jgi:hypothetical protein